MISYMFIFMTLVFLILNMFYIKKDEQKKAFVYKVFASLSFLSIGIFTLYYSNFNLAKTLILIALGCGVIGDIVLGLKVILTKHKNLFFNLGVVSFGIGHLLYALGLYFINSNYIYLIISLLISIVFAISYQLIMKKYKFEIKGLEVPLFIYSLVIVNAVSYGFMISGSNLNLLVTTFGILAILVSDIILSIVYFTLKKDDLNLQALNHLIYYIGQILIAISLLII